MTPQGPEWRRTKAEAILDAEALKWEKYRIVSTVHEPWAGQKEIWYKVEPNGTHKVWTLGD